MSERQKLYGLDLLRFIAVLNILFGHLTENYLLKYDIPLYNTIESYYGHCFGILCEFLFMLSGFFFYYTASKKITLLDFVVKKWIRLGPVVVFYVLLYCLFPKQVGVFTTRAFAFLHCFFFAENGTIGFKGMTHLWYLDCMILSMIFYFYLLKNFDFKIVKLIMAIIIFFSYTLTVGKDNFYPADPYINGIFFCYLLRALANVGLGFFLGYLHDKCSLSLNLPPLPYIIYSLFEISLFIAFIGTTFIRKWAIPTWLYIYLFAILILMFASNNGFFTRFINSKIKFSFLKYTYSVYAMQFLGWALLIHNVWGNPVIGVTEYPLAHLVFGLVVCYIIGAPVFYFIEEPSRKFLEKKYAQFKQRQNAALQRDMTPEHQEKA